MISRQTLPGGAAPCEALAQEVREPQVVHRGGAEVDGTGIELGQRLRMAIEPREGAVDDVAIQPRAHVELLGGGHDRAGRLHLAGLRIDHAQQDLEVATAVSVVLQAHDALAIQAEMAIAQGRIQPRGPAERRGVFRHRVLRGFVGGLPQSVAAPVLGRRAGRVGQPQEFGIVGLPAAEADRADAGRSRHEIAPAGLAVVANGREQVLESGVVGFGIAVVQQQDELVAGQASHQAARRQDRLQHARDAAQEGVPGGLPARIVHQLEVVDIDEGQPQRVGLPAMGERGRYPVRQAFAVGEAGERVGPRAPALRGPSVALRRWPPSGSAGRPST